MKEIEIIGMGNRKAGIGKDGKPYDIVTVAFKFADERLNGFNCGTCIISGTYVDKGITVGSVCQAVILWKNYSPYIHCIV